MKKCFFVSIILILVGIFTISCKESDEEISLFSISEASSAQNIKIYKEKNTVRNGNLGGNRTAANTLCENSTNLPSGYSKYLALVSFTGDAIKDFSTNYAVPIDKPVVANGMEIGSNWGDILDGIITNSLETTGLMGSNEYWWSGSDSTGDATASNCINWSSDSGSPDEGKYGSSSFTSFLWIEFGNNGCSAQNYLLCIAY